VVFRILHYGFTRFDFGQVLKVALLSGEAILVERYTKSVEILQAIELYSVMST
jgi:hypothetical protein